MGRNRKIVRQDRPLLLAVQLYKIPGAGKNRSSTSLEAICNNIITDGEIYLCVTQSI